MDARSTLKNTKRNVWAAALLMVFGLAWIAPQAFAQLLPPLPLPGGSLIVTITSPAPGSSVSGTTPVNASVSIVSSLTVSQVQFFRDGNFIGSDSAAPYSVSWNTTSTNNGSHTLTAVATDVLGVRWNSNPVTVTVSNGPPPDTTPPTVPTGLTASAVSSSQINLSWTASSDNVGVSGYRVYRNGTQIATTGTTSCANTGLSPSTTYSYTVAAFDAAGNLSAQSSPASATTPAAPDTTPPSVPTGLRASAVSSSQINLSWAASSDNVGVSGYRVFRDGTQIATTSATSFPNTGLSPSTTYSYTVAAFDAAGNLSAQSSPASATTPAAPDTTPPSVPTGLRASAVSSSQINLSWAASSDNVGVSGYRVYRDGAQIATTSTTFFANTGLSPSTTYSYAVAAFDAAGNLSAQSSPASATTPAAPDTTPPSVPTGLTASAVSSSQINLSWAASSDNVGVSGYRVFRDGTQIATTSATSFPNTGLSPSTTYSYTVAAFDAAGNLSAQSSPASATTPAASDTTPPTVSITSPANGAPVKGTVIVTASASDNVGVVGVQFLLDNGVNGSADVTTAPYSVSWNTATVSDGSHKITAIARDAAGNSTPSSPVTVIVNNNAPPPPPPATRFEDTDPSIVYSGPGWRSDMYVALSNGGATDSDQAGAQATFTFTGTSVSWIGGRWVEEGIARVFLDGGFVTEVDTYSKTKEVQVPLFTAVGLADTSHTLTIVVTGRKNIASNLPFVLVDAFDVPAATISRLQETDPAVTFAGSGWLQGVTGDEYSGGTVAGSLTAGDQATLTFTGTGVRWLGELGPDNGGIARVFLDGAFMQEVDTYAPSPDPGHHSTFQAEHFKATGLADTSHTLTIEVTGRQDPAAAKATVVVDAFDVITSGTRREETDPAVSYTAGWLQGNRDHPYSEGTAAVSTIPGDRATFTFTGTSVSWIGYRGPQAGIARVILDGSVVTDSLDLYIPSEGPQEAVFTLPGLAAGSHTLTIEVTGSKNPASAGTAIVVDAFDVTP